MTRGEKTKGEITKEKIIDATLLLISESGIESLSHRNIAKQADVRLSLTSYYFGDLDNLICQAFDRFFEAEKAEIRKLKDKAAEVLSTQDADLNTTVNKVSDLMVEHIMSNTNGFRHRQTSIECAFNSGLHHSEALALRVQDYNRYFKKALISQLLEFMPDNPHVNTDASLIMAVLRESEYQTANKTIQVDHKKTHAKLTRIFSLVANSQAQL